MLTSCLFLQLLIVEIKVMGIDEERGIPWVYLVQLFYNSMKQDDDVPPHSHFLDIKRRKNGVHSTRQ